MITADDYESLKSSLKVVSGLGVLDPLGSKLLAVGSGHLNFLKYALNDLGRLSAEEQYQLQDLIYNFRDIVMEYLDERQAC